MHTYVFDIEHIDQTNGERQVHRVKVTAPPGDRITANEQAWQQAIDNGISLGSIIHARLIVDHSEATP